MHAATQVACNLDSVCMHTLHQLHSAGCQLTVSAIVNTFADAIVASDQVNSILLAAVTEVIEVVSDYRLDTIVQKAKGGSLASASEARLEGSCAGILA